MTFAFALLLALGWVGVDADVPGELVGSGEPLLAARVGASVRFLAGVGPDVSSL